MFWCKCISIVVTRCGEKTETLQFAERRQQHPKRYTAIEGKAQSLQIAVCTFGLCLPNQSVSRACLKMLFSPNVPPPVELSFSPQRPLVAPPQHQGPHNLRTTSAPTQK